MAATRLPAALITLLLANAPALAEPGAAVPGVSGASFVSGLLGLVFIVALLLGAAWLFKRIGGSSGFGNSVGMKIVSGIAVGPRERILLLEVGETWVVVGVTAGQMRTLHTMAKGELPPAAEFSAGAPFAAWLKQISERGKNDARG